jgi:hypothetical protein
MEIVVELVPVSASGFKGTPLRASAPIVGN